MAVEMACGREGVGAQGGRELRSSKKLGKAKLGKATKLGRATSDSG
jgi:hypothetical protein